MKNDLKGQRLDSEIHKQKNEKSAKNRRKRVCSTGTLANPRRLRYQEIFFVRAIEPSQVGPTGSSGSVH